MSGTILSGATAVDSSVSKLLDGVGGRFNVYPSSVPAREGAAPSVDGTIEHTVSQAL